MNLERLHDGIDDTFVLRMRAFPHAQTLADTMVQSSYFWACVLVTNLQQN